MVSPKLVTRVLSLVLVATGLVACVKENPTVLVATVVASQDVNPDGAGRASPVALRIYELKDRETFESASFFDLYERGQQTLGADLLNSTEIKLVPGGTKDLRLELSPDARFVGVVAAYRAIEDATWRATVPIPTTETTEVEIRLEKLVVGVGN
jgi:type VI secretion system protein VasD